MEKIDGIALCGFDDVFEGAGDAVMGAKGPPPKKGAGSGTAPPKPLPPDAYKKKAGIKPSVAVANHGKVLTAAAKTAKAAGGKLASAIKVFAAKPKPVVSTVKAGAPPAKAARAGAPPKVAPKKVTIVGEDVMLGEAAKPLTPKAKQAVAKLDAANKKAAAEKKKLHDKLKGAKAKFDDLHNKIKNQRKAAIALRRSKKAGLRGEDDFSMEDFNFETELPTESTAPDLLNLVNLPPAPPMNAPPVKDYKTVGGIPYDGPWTPGMLISFKLSDPGNASNGGVVTGQQDGYMFGGNKDQKGWPGEDPSQWIYVHGKRGLRNWWENVGGKEATASIVARSMQEGWGPIIGNPMNAEYKSLRVDQNGVPFWYPQEAPDSVTAPLKQAAQLAANAIEAAAKAAAEAEETARAKAAADAAAEQEAQNAANALAESQAASEANVAASQAAATQATTEAQSAQEDLAQRQAEREAAAEERRMAAEERKEQAAQDAEYRRQQIEAAREQAELDRIQRQQDMEAMRAQAELDRQNAEFNAQQAREAARANQELALRQQQQTGQFVAPQTVTPEGEVYDGGNYGGEEGADVPEFFDEDIEDAASEFDDEIDEF